MSISRGKALLKTSLTSQRPKRTSQTPKQTAGYYCKAGLDQDGLERRHVSKEKGLGVFSTKAFPRGAFLLEYCGTLSKASQNERQDASIDERDNAEYPRYYKYFFKYNGTEMCIDARETSGHLGHLVNDAPEGSLECNSAMKLMTVGSPRLCLFASRDVCAGEELHYDYGDCDNLWWRKQKLQEGLTDSDDESIVNPFADSPGSCSIDETDDAIAIEEQVVDQVMHTTEPAKYPIISLRDLTFSGLKKNEENKYCSKGDDATDSTCTQNEENEHFSNDSGAAGSTCTQVCVPMTNESKTHPDSSPVASEQDKSSQRRRNGLNRVSSDTSLEKICGTSYESAADGIAESDYESSGSEYEQSENSESDLSESEAEGCERVEDSRSKGSEVIPMVPQLKPSVTVESTSGRKGKKKHACLFCENLYANMARHITLVHKEEPQVAKILSLPKLTQERKRLWDVLVKKGDFEHNYSVLESGKGAVIPKYRPSSPASHGNGKYIPCQFCRGLYGRKNLWKHQRRCKEKSANDENWKKRSSAITSGQMLLPIQKTVRAEMFERVILRMKNDHIRAVAEKDETIMAYGQRLFDKHGHQSHKLNYISQKIRELGRLLIEARTISNKIVTLENCVEQGNWDIVVAATKQVAGFNPQSNKFGTPSLALKLGHSLNKCASLISFSGLKNDDELKRKKGETFMKLYSMGWEDAVSTKALSTLVSEKYNKQQLLPLVEDVVKLNSFIREEITKTKKKLDLASTSNFTNAPAYQDLARLCLAQIILFNRKRSGEAQRMTLSGYRSAGTSGGKQLDSVVQTALSTFEKQLCRSHMRVEIEGKRGRKVAVILTDDMKQNLDYLIKHRQAAGVCTTNDLLFAKPGNAVHPIRGSDCLRKFATECGADQPERLTSTKLRKQLATLAQVLNLSENNQDILATFQGHDIRVHREYYRLPESTLQVAKVAKLLHAINTGTIQNYKGMDFEEIEFEDSVPLEKEMDSNDSSSDNDEDSISPTETSTSAGKQRHSRQDPSTAKKRKTTERTGKRCHHQPWTAEEKNFLAQEFKSSIRIERLAGVGKRACEEAKTKAAPLLQSRTWIHIKSQVKNMIERKRKGIPL